jgi:3,4-dihydroxy 2-butanone 4-phosphate synthase/GTP cyclohydrolase II
MDGSLSTQAGTRFQLSGPASAKFTHQLRASHDAILVGIGTVLADDPRLNVRLISGDNPQPVVLDSSLRIPLHSKLIYENDKRPWIFTKEDVNLEKAYILEDGGCKIIRVSTDNQGKLDLVEVARKLSDLKIRNVMVEGGSQVITNFYKAKLIDLLIITIAPVIIGGLPSVKTGELTELVSLKRLNSTYIGRDLVLWGQIAS